MEQRKYSKMKKMQTNEIGIFTILLIGENPYSISIADNINSNFAKTHKGLVSSSFKFNIVEDIEQDVKSNSWFNEFIFETTTISRFNNIIVSSRFKKWMITAPQIEKLYMKQMLQALNTIIVDVSDGDVVKFHEDIPQFKYQIDNDFLKDLISWIGSQVEKIIPSLPMINLVRSLCGKNLPYIGDVFGCLSGKKYEKIRSVNSLRFDVPILFDEFCKMTKGMTIDEISNCVFTRSNSALSTFFR